MRGRFVLVFILVVASAAALTASRASAAGQRGAGTWRRLPPAPIVPDDPRVASVWTGRKLLVFARAQLTPPWSVNVAAAYDPSADGWRRLAPPPGGKGNFEGRYSAVWTGKEMLVWGPTINEAYKPVGDRWRQLPLSPYGGPDGIVVWTGREMIGWGGGCCGDVVSDGVAFNPVANSWRKLARSPLAGSQHPLGAWTGRELLLFVSGFDPDGKPWPARLARAAAYNPATDSWRRIAPLPEARAGASAVWDGRELLVVGGTGAQAPALAAVGFAYDPASNRWRRLAPMPSGRFSAAAVWTGRQLLLWGGGTGRAGSPATASHGLAYDPQTDRWSTLPQAPLAGRDGPSAVWTGSEMIVWGGTKGVCRPGGVYGCHTRLFADGAAFRPTSP